MTGSNHKRVSSYAAHSRQRSFTICSILWVAAVLVLTIPVTAQVQSMESLITPQHYESKRISSYDRTGGNADAVPIAPGETITLMDQTGPGIITHIWFTIASPESMHLKKLVLHMYWDGEATPSVEAPIGDFFGLGLGQYFKYESAPLSVASDKALNSFFQMPFPKKARITVTNDGTEKVNSFYFNIDYRAYAAPLAKDTLYFHAQYRQATPAKGWNSEWKSNGDGLVNDKKNLDGEGNYVWMEARGSGHYVGVTMSVLQNQDGWFGEGDDIFLLMAKLSRLSTAPVQRTIFSAHGTLALIHLPMRPMVLLLLAKNLPAADPPSIVSTWIRRSPSQNPSKQQLNMGMPTCALTIFTLWRTGIRQNPMHLFPDCRQSRTVCRNYFQQAAQVIRKHFLSGGQGGLCQATFASRRFCSSCITAASSFRRSSRTSSCSSSSAWSTRCFATLSIAPLM